MPESAPASVKLPLPLRDRVKHLASARNTSAHAIMLQAIEAYVDREEKREALRQEGIAAWEDFQRTGLHLTGEEVHDWVKKLRRDTREPLPPCHVAR